MIHIALVLGLMIGCSSSAPKGATALGDSVNPGGGTGGSETASAGTGAAQAVNAGCIVDAAAQAACEAKGAPFAYGPEPYVYCSGVAPEPGAEAATHERIRNTPCQCFDTVELAKYQDECGRIPSMPPDEIDPTDGGE